MYIHEWRIHLVRKDMAIMRVRRPLHPVLIGATVALPYPKHSLLICAAFMFYLLPASAFGADAAISTTAGNLFSPANVTINEGDKVIWSNLAPTHNVAQSANALSNVWDGSGFRSGAVGAFDTFQHTFPTAGTFFFVCEPHAPLSGMKGTVTVLPGVDAENPYVDLMAVSNGVGTEGSPFDNLREAVLAADPAGSTIRIKNGSTNETFTGAEVISQILTLISTNGLVIIGDQGARSAERSGGFISRARGDASPVNDEDSDS